MWVSWEGGVETEGVEVVGVGAVGTAGVGAIGRIVVWDGVWRGDRGGVWLYASHEVFAS